MDTGLLILRVAVGVLFAGHGAQKLFGWFGGPGIRGLGGFLESLGYPRPRQLAVVHGSIEVAAGLLVATGFLMPLGTAAIIGVMLNAILAVNRSRGLFGGYELDLVYATTATALAFIGPGAYSIDRLLGWTLSGATWGMGALALALVTGALIYATRRPAPAAAPTEEQRAA